MVDLDPRQHGCEQGSGEAPTLACVDSQNVPCGGYLFQRGAPCVTEIRSSENKNANVILSEC